MESDMAAYKSDFLQEVYECLDIFNQSFVDLENGDTAAIDEIFRITHTIKGMAGFLGYASLEHLCHTMEEVLCGIKNGDIEIDGELVDILLSTVDRITDIVKQIENADNDNVKIDDLVEAFENYDKIKNVEHESLCPLSAENSVPSPAIESSQNSEENISPSPEYQEDKAENRGTCGTDGCNLMNRGTCSTDECNLVLDVTLVKDCAMKGLRASLIIESLKDISKLAKTEPDENDMENGFDGCFKVFLSGDNSKVEELMDRISEIEQFNISEIKPLNGASDKEIKRNNSISEKSQPDVISTTILPSETLSVPSDTTSVSEVNSRNSLHSYIYGLIARMHRILDGIGKSVNCFKKTESAGVLLKKKCKDSRGDIPEQQETLEQQETPASELDIELGPAVSDQKLQTEEFGIPDHVPEKVSEEDLLDWNVSDRIIDGPEIKPDKFQSHAENLKGSSPQVLELCEASGIGESEPGSNNHLSESESSTKAMFDPKRQETIRVRTSNLDNIMNLVGELVINKGRLLQISQQYNLPELGEATGTLDKSISSLQDEVMRIRMVKIERVFSKFPRMVRDLSRKFNKNIEFEIEGQDTELDRTILDDISDPLVHLVRNSVDHGIELPEERSKAGKSEVGQIKLSARREKNNVIIEIEDDGRGIDVEVIKKKAVEKGLLSSFDVESLSEEEVRMLIFAPGFSTKDVPTEISGRGVGMDAVKTAVEKLGGKVRIYSKKGEFTKIRIDLPPTVAIIKSLLVDVGPETYAIPISNVVKALSVGSSDYKLIKETPLLYIRDKLIPILELKEFFDIECEKPDRQIAIIVEKENEEVGLIVDSIIDQQEIVIKPLGNVLSNSKGFIGATILGDGRVIPIIDVSMLIKGDIDD